MLLITLVMGILGVDSCPPDLPGPRQGAAAATWRGHVLVVAGSVAAQCGPTGVTHYSTVVIGPYPHWELYHDMGDANARTHHAVAVLGDALYVLGGYGGVGPVGTGVAHPLDSVTMVDLAHPAAPAAARMPLPTGPTTNLGAVAVSGTSLVIAGGYGYGPNGNTVLSACWRYDSVADAWTKLSPMLTARGGFAFAAVMPWPRTPSTTAASAAYAIGGFGKHNATFYNLAAAEKLDLATWTWSEAPAMPEARAQLQAAVWRGSRIVVLGGTNATADLCYGKNWQRIAQRDVLALETRRGAFAGAGAAEAAWSKVGTMPTPRGFCAVAMENDTLLSMGGFNGTEDAATVQGLDLATGHWCV